MVLIISYMLVSAGCRLVVVFEQTLCRCDLGQEDATLDVMRASTSDYLFSLFCAQLSTRAAQRTPGAPLFLGVLSDVLSLGVVSRLEYLADATVYVLGNGRMELTLRQKPGFVRRPVTISSSGEWAPAAQKAIIPSTPQQPESTFSLHANERQAAARAAVVLPHVREAQRAIERPVLAYDYDPEEEIDV